MKKKNYSISSSFEKYLKSGNENIFMHISVIIAIMSVMFFYCGIRVSAAALIFSVAVFFIQKYFLKYGWKVRLGWSCIMFAIICIMCDICEIKSPIPLYFIGIILSSVVCSLLYVAIPKISYKLHLSDTSKTKGIYLVLLVFVVLIFCVLIDEDNRVSDAMFEKENFVSVKYFEKDIYNGNVIYFIECEKGDFYVYAKKYPEVRYINSDSKIRVLTVKHPEIYGRYASARRFEIKN